MTAIKLLKANRKKGGTSRAGRIQRLADEHGVPVSELIEESSNHSIPDDPEILREWKFIEAEPIKDKSGRRWVWKGQVVTFSSGEQFSPIADQRLDSVFLE